MKRIISGMLACGLALLLLQIPCLASQSISPETAQTWTNQAVDALADITQAKSPVLADQTVFPAGSSSSDWTAIALACAGQDEAAETYRKALERFVTQLYADPLALQREAPTTWQRIALTVLALGGDPTAFGTTPEGSAVNLIADGTYEYGGDFSAETPNALAFACIALDSRNFDVPDSAAYQRSSLLQLLVQKQNPDGGFGLTQGDSDADLTAMCLQALAPYSDQTEIGQAIDKGLAYLETQLAQSADEQSASMEARAQLIIALCALQIDPETDARFFKDGQGLVSQLGQYRCSDGSFAHEIGQTQGDLIATQQAILALCAWNRYLEGAPWIYDFRQPTFLQQFWPYCAVGVVVLALGSALLLKKRKKEKR